MNNNPDELRGEAIPPHDYPLLENPQAMGRVLALIEENLGGENLDPLKLSRIQLPAGRDTEFRVETASGEERRATIIGVITAFRQARTYWIKAYGTGRSGPPDCSSKDGFTGVGNPGGNCTVCPMAAFGTARAANGGAGPGQACKELRQLLILMPGQLLPHLLSIPPTSLANFTKYSLNLISAGESYWRVTTRMTLETAASVGGIPYPRIRFALYSAIPEPQAAVLAPYHMRMRVLLAPLVVDSSAYEVTSEAERIEETGSSENEPPF